MPPRIEPDLLIGVLPLGIPMIEAMGFTGCDIFSAGAKFSGFISDEPGAPGV